MAKIRVAVRFVNEDTDEVAGSLVSQSYEDWQLDRACRSVIIGDMLERVEDILSFLHVSALDGPIAYKDA